MTRSPDPCRGCGAAFPPKVYRGNPKLYCTPACRQRFKYRTGVTKPHVPVAHEQVCGACERKHAHPRITRTCSECRAAGRVFRVDCRCGVTVWRREQQTYCSRRCRMAFRPAAGRPKGPTRRPEDERTRKGRRRAHEQAAPGLSERGRVALLARWRRQSRTCWACSAPVATVDHLVPLTRGGTNYEGNLAPACRSHNSSRGALLIMEWRWRRGWHGSSSEARISPSTQQPDGRADAATRRGATGASAGVAATSGHPLAGAA